MFLVITVQFLYKQDSLADYQNKQFIIIIILGSNYWVLIMAMGILLHGSPKLFSVFKITVDEKFEDIYFTGEEIKN